MGTKVHPKISGLDAAEPARVHAFGANIPAATDRDGISAAQQLGEAGNLLINGIAAVAGAWAAGFDGGRLVTVYSGGNLSALTFTVTGTDKDGVAQTEDLAGPNNGTTTGTKYFQDVTQVAVDGAVGTDVEVGFAASLVCLNLSRGNVFQLSPANNEAVKIAPYGASGSGFADRISLSVTSPASLTTTWADGTTPTDCRVYFPGGTEPTLTASGTDWFDMVADGTTASSDTIWYAVNSAQDLKA